MADNDQSWLSVWTLVYAYLIYQTLLFVYRITFHPLAKFPGPKLAAMSTMYEFWFDGIKGGKYTQEVARMHSQYGPIIRIGPEQLHCNDPAFTDKVYPGGRAKRDRFQWAVAAHGPSIFGTIDHNLHRKRRAPLNTFFSKASISKLETLIHPLSHRLCDILLARAGTGEPVNVNDAYSCFSSDVIITYCFGQPGGFLDKDDFDNGIREGIHITLATLPLLRQWPWIRLIYGGMNTFLTYMGQSVPSHVKSGLAGAVEKGEQDSRLYRRSIFNELLDSNLPAEEKSERRLLAEALNMIGAGTETVAWTLSVGTYHLLAKPEILHKIKTELDTIVTDPNDLPAWSVLEQLPYLISLTPILLIHLPIISHSAIIKEILRLSYGVATRIARSAPDEALQYTGTFKSNPISWTIPTGTAISMTTAIMHHDESIFPDSHEFIPERWLKDDGTRRMDLDKYLLSFNKGSRQCIGINLAYCELYVALTALILKVFPRLELFETTEADVKYDHDMFVPMPYKGSKGVRVLVK
ncbi:trichodiene oxygenase [Microthyrium microscopicum]|uniref:Trichodiene oxygenase n=1 Tax=Microthyrium microscopicum TaxID=703497 RepID=A0A6A6U6U1_9PEZI|nr:trichodiene oxygenase [Microthyrium microscopicum]